ncbi:hypothetical protein EXE51_13840 [Halorubrum sp. CGM5_25_10-8B]|nr:hypothetical protein EXE51_13840 [Halorubrum sp. CGM5_25_10-8B]
MARSRCCLPQFTPNLTRPRLPPNHRPPPHSHAGSRSRADRGLSVASASLRPRTAGTGPHTRGRTRLNAYEGAVQTPARYGDLYERLDSDWRLGGRRPAHPDSDDDSVGAAPSERA